MSSHTILLVDDEPDILEFLGYNLKKAGYEVLTAGNGQDALKAVKTAQPDLIILDVMMPGMDGMELCRQLRSMPKLEDCLITFLTARNEDYSQITGFDSGADDYITKPIKPNVFLSRVKALLRRKERASESSQLEVGDLRIHPENYKVDKGNQTIELPKKEFELLMLLASRPGKVFQREEILKKVWGDDVVVGDRTIDVHIRKLREKLGEKYFHTVKGVGYKFEF